MNEIPDMTAMTVLAPGTERTEHGPCDDACTHADCAFDRETAETPCQMCKKPIGYDTPFYWHDPGFVHKDCFKRWWLVSL